MEQYAAIIDANINRIGEGLRVIEEYFRFVDANKEATSALSKFRKQLHQHAPQTADQLAVRNTHQDMRAKEQPNARKDILDLLTANFKRVSEALRVLEEYTGASIWNALRYDSYELEKALLLPLHKRVLLSGVYVISEDPNVLIEAAEMGAVMLQLRSKYDSKEQLYNKATQFMQQRPPESPPFIINDYLDIALSLKVDGLHTGQDDLPPSVHRQCLGPTAIIGKTTHDLDQGRAAKAAGADYISVGPIWETPSKPGREAIGTDYLNSVTQLDIPYVAIGGINLERLRTLKSFRPFMIGVIRSYKEILRETKNKSYFNLI